MEHISHQIPPKAHTAMYNWHKFWGRKTWNVVSEFVDTYCPKNGIVMDPFSGSGVTALEALKLGRRVIAVDLNPVATEILRLTIQHVEPSKLHEAYERVEQDVRKKITDLYLTECNKCKEQIPVECAVWKRDEKKYLSLKELRYKCQYCGEVVAKGGKPASKDIKHIKDIIEEFRKKKLWYPKNRLYYSDGLAFKEKQQYDSLSELFTPRNLYALAILMHSINDEKDKILKDFLKIAFSSMVHLCSTMVAVSDPLPTSHHTSFSSTGWTQHSYWYAREFMEQNVWSKFESAIVGHQGLIKAKIESNKYFKDIKITHNLNSFLNDTTDICIINGSCIDVFDRMPARSVDYIFTDPPYDASIQYGELSYLWAAWLKKDERYIEKISSEEIVRNERQHKDFEVYHTLLRRSFDGMHKVLKLNKYLTLTFYNPTFKVRNATIRAGTHAGFDLEKIHHQPTAQKSGKSLLQPFGSAMGDFYLRFHKPTSFASKAEAPEEIDQKRFEKIVVDTTIQLLAERAEPTPYTIVINYIDPILARNGYFSSLHTGLDVKTVLKNHTDIEFKLVEERIGGARGKLWWFKDPKVVYRLKDALEQYGRQIAGGYWLLKPQVSQRVNQHNEIIGVLAEAGEALGYKIWVGKKEQSGSASGILGTTKLLRTYVNSNLNKLNDIEDIDTVEMIDLLWITGKNVVAAFEVESTTSMTSGLVRGSNLSTSVPKYLVIPEEREEQLKRKMKSPMFTEWFENDNWQILYFDTLRNNYKKLKNQTETIQKLVNQKVSSAMAKESEANYNLFVEQD